MNKTHARNNRTTQRLATASKFTFAKNTVFMIINIQAQYKLKNNIVRGHFSLPGKPRTVLLGCQTVYYDLLNAKQSSKMNLSGLCGNAWFPCNQATHSAIQELGCAYKITHISANTCPRLLNMVSN